jgi:hypothetical protein
MRDTKQFPLMFALIACVLSFSARATAQGGSIVNATYGAGNRQVNVTQRVQSLVRNGWLNFHVTNQVLAVPDPALGVVKRLSIDVRQGTGQVRNYQFQEYSQVNLQVGFGNIPGNSVVSASYGYGGTRRDVTARVQSLVHNGTLNFWVTNDALGGDPAPNRVKELRMRVVQRNGQIRDYQFPEKSLVNIQVGGGFNPPPVMPPPIPGGTWKGDPVATCINAVRSRIQQDYGNRVTINLPPGAARVTPISVGDLLLPVNGTGQFTPMNQPTSNTQYSCSIDKRFGTVSSVNYSRPNVQPQPR